MKTKISLLITIAFSVLMLNVAKATIYTVEVADFSFTPNALNINSGDTVRWIWVSGTHTTTSTSVPSGASTWNNSMTSSNTQFQMKFTVSGNYNYHCSIHTMMTGTITVAPASGISEIDNSSFNVKAYPTPFSDNLAISFTTNVCATAKISIYDITGNLVKIITNMDYEKGNHIINWNGKNENGETVNHGLYFYMIESKGISKVISGKIVFGY
jgi:plastocyanin